MTNTINNVPRELKKCAACRAEKPVNEMSVCMHNQMHRYVCDSKCMDDFYNPPKITSQADKLAAQLSAALEKVEELQGRLIAAHERVGRYADQRDQLAALLARCQETLDCHRDAVLWGDVCAALAPACNAATKPVYLGFDLASGPDMTVYDCGQARAMLAAPAAPAADAGLVEALEKLARLGNGDKYGNSDGNLIAQAALAANSAKGVV